jgi:hypothetical protein
LRQKKEDKMKIYTIILLTLTMLVSCIADTTAQSADTSNRYGVGGSGNYAPYLGVDWFREWDHFHRPVAPNPPQRFWTVAKLDNRIGDCMPGTLSATRENIDAVFACDVAVIEGLVGEGYVGQIWEIGNEPNWYPYVLPQTYAYQFHLYYEFITGLDPTAQMMIGGISLYPGSWQNWLDGFTAAYVSEYGTSPPVDVWNCHPYDTFDTSAGTRAIAKIISFRNWLDGAGLDDKTFWITEFGKGNWLPEPEANIVAYIETVCGWLNDNAETNKIERWFWWGVLAGNNGMGANGLFSAGPYNRDTVTLAGDAYIALSGRVFVDGPEYSRDSTRATGTMRNPYASIDEAMNDSSPGTVIYNFQTGLETGVSPHKIYLPLVVFVSPLSANGNFDK